MSEDFDVPNFAPAEPLMFQKWAERLHLALREADIVRRFATETGHTWNPPSSLLDTSIDEAVGAASAYMKAFVPWFNVNIWSDMGGDHA
ncbi:hypothetical protein [Microvirga sesbaniae]|uniref:hypothetical protein n=1 Tax=Microvirga sesbaniae TaxID=681392 RepID=UPI0021C76DEA|nr:hypothetical protein [Microvirga sp. HBU67692]